MPDKDGKLTAEEKQIAIDWLQETAASMACPACGQKSFIIGDHMVASLVHSGKGVTLGGITYPQIMVMCTNCSHTFHFNAVRIGIVKPPDEAEDKEGEGPKKEAEKKEGEKADG